MGTTKTSLKPAARPVPGPVRDLPAEIQRRLDGWFCSFWFFVICHYGFGIGGVVAATIAAATTGEAVKVAAIIASTCMAVVGFVQPDHQYRKLVGAWRILDDAAQRYRHGLIEIEELIDGMKAAEARLQKQEDDTPPGKQ
ncbi:hypothetical protein [Pseudoduganella violacea]|uniref:DUF4231 domain-containing protein n=1 Tax=Pseudoduganella violacea TaxID=1715466 RepID=A0A7W5BD00_9BURK|nr:hypothetical protein [Pseudoduganella violacea]MBB3120045.1 hypothetical protein [Pseudoduganella violacea]